jgi:hypothetical protein
MDPTQTPSESPTSNLDHPILKTLEDYGKTSIELYKQKTILHVANVSSSFLSQMGVAFIFMLIVFTIITGLSLWVGEKMGSAYLGFFSVALGLVVLYILLVLMLGQLKKEIKNKIILKLTKL